MSRGGQHSINEVIGEVTRALIPTNPKNEIRQRICEQFTASELYSFAWIGRYNPEKEEVIPTASAGSAENTLTGITITEESPRAELTNEAVRTREVTVGQNRVDDPPYEDGRDHDLKHDYQTYGVIPLVYEETLYGVLHLATNRPRGFAAAERESLAELGVTIGYAFENAESPANTDSTDRKEAEAGMTRVTVESEQERRLYETIISSTPDLVYAFDLDYRFIFANDALLEMWGQTFEESIGKTLRENGYEPWHAEMHEREIDQVVETKEPIRGEVAFQHAELGRRIYDYIFAPVLNDEGEVEAIAGTTRDITEHKEAEEALQKSEERFRALVTASSDVVYRMSPDWSEMHHLEGKEFIADTHESTSDWLDKYIHSNDQERVKDAINEAIRTKSIFELEHRVEQVDGSLGWTYSRAVPMLDEDGDIVEWIGMASDITERKERERELERALDLLEQTEHIADVGGWEIDTETQDVFWTDHTFELLEVEADEEPPLEEALDMYHDEDQPIVEDAVEEALASGDAFDVEVRLMTGSGELRWLRLQGEPETVGGNIVSFRGAAQDVTERKQREQHLEQYETIVEAVNDGVYVVDEDGVFRMVNETYAEMLGYDRDELVGREASTLVDDETAEQIEELYPPPEDGLVDQPPVEVRLRTASGEWLPVEASLGLLPGDSDSDWHWVGVVRDISERRERERALEESERRYRALVENFPNGSVGLFDEDLRYTAVGGQLFDRLDFDLEDRLGQGITEIHPPELLEEIRPYFEAALDGEANSFEVGFSDRHLHANTLPVRDADDEVFAGMLVIQDVTERREYERQLETSNERLEQFAYAASHDLQEPLRMVSSYLQLVEGRYADELDEEGREFIEFAVDGAERMREMIGGLLQYSRVDTRGDPFEPVDLEEVLADVRQDLQVKIQETDADITAEDLPQVYGDGSQLNQAFQNLLDNAIEYSGDDPPRVHVGAERDGDQWIISVRDEGIGIDSADPDKVFEVFQSLQGHENGGTGIGLALVERIVERHDGAIWVDSEPGEGATFSFTLSAAGKTDE